MLLSGSLCAPAQDAPARESKTLPSVTVKERADPEEGRGPLWFQLYQQADRSFNHEPVRRAERAGDEALALGARAVLIGRPYTFGLANAGAHGVAQVWRLLRDALEIVMALTGCRTPADVGHKGLPHRATRNFTIDSKQ